MCLAPGTFIVFRYNCVVQPELYPFFDPGLCVPFGSLCITYSNMDTTTFRVALCPSMCNPALVKLLVGHWVITWLHALVLVGMGVGEGGGLPRYLPHFHCITFGNLLLYMVQADCYDSVLPFCFPLRIIAGEMCDALVEC